MTTQSPSKGTFPPTTAPVAETVAGRDDSPARPPSIITCDTASETAEQIARLSARIVELETLNIQLTSTTASAESKLKNIGDKYEELAKESSEIIVKKNSQIDIMRVQLNRYEFAIKEAILFLSKPAEAYDQWLASGSQAGLLGFAPARQDTLEMSKSKSGSISQLLDTAFFGKDKTLAAASTATTTAAAAANKSPQSAAGAIEIRGLESLRLALNYLKLAQQSVMAIREGQKDGADVVLPRLSPTKSPATPSPSDDVPLFHIYQALNSDPSKPIANASSAAAATDAAGSLVSISGSIPTNAPAPMPTTTPGFGMSSGPGKGSDTASITTTQHPGMSTSPSKGSLVIDAEDGKKSLHPSPIPERATTTTTTTTTTGAANRSMARPKSAASLNPFLLKAATVLPEEDDSDLSSGQNSNAARATTSPSRTAIGCPHCRELRLQNEHYVDTVEYLKRDITTLANQIEEERLMRERIQLSKDILDQELEELTAQLFDQANKMVIDEARMRDNLENANKELRCELKDWIRRFETRGEELKDLQRSLRALQAAKARSASITALSPGTSVANLDQLSGSKIYRMAYGQLPVDGYIFIEFQDHIKQTALASSLPPSQAQATTQSTLFMRRCMVEDIEPCLFYNYQHPQFAGMNLTLFFKPGAGMSSAFKRKLLDGTMRGSLLFTPFYSSTESLPAADPIERLDQDRRISTVFAAGPPPKTRCTICTVVRDCEYRMRFSSEVGASPTGGPSSSAATIEWMSLCRFCRERVIAVTDFFTYINHLRQGAIGPGKQGASLLGIYRHVLYLRRRMASTRIGSGAMFEVDPATNPDWEKMIQILN